MSPDMLAGGPGGAAAPPGAGAPGGTAPQMPGANPAMMLAQLLRRKGGTKGKHRRGKKKVK